MVTGLRLFATLYAAVDHEAQHEAGTAYGPEFNEQQRDTSDSWRPGLAGVHQLMSQDFGDVRG